MFCLEREVAVLVLVREVEILEQTLEQLVAYVRSVAPPTSIDTGHNHHRHHPLVGRVLEMARVEEALLGCPWTLGQGGEMVAVVRPLVAP
jgi:hypothetical protein